MQARPPTTWSRHGRAGAALMLSLLLTGCALLAPLPAPTTLAQRLAALPTRDLPLEGPVVIHWNEHQVPFIVAERDADAAFALGLVHAHLRLGQMEILRRIAQGRLAEMAGPIATDIDHGLRLLDFGRAAPAIEAALPAETRAWLEAYVRGINHTQGVLAEPPHEFRVLGLKREPWRVADVLTIGRLAGTDVNWLVWANLLRLRDRPDWPRLWARLVDNGRESMPSFKGEGDLARLGALLAGFSRSGSNSLALAPARSTTGAAILANDPHLGIYAPNLWLIAGLKSPSLHAVGLMVPGLPFFALGRNPWIAWGGTNMRAAASDLFDVSGLGPDEMRGRRETIRVRWWFDRTVALRETPWGPVVSDASLFEGLEAPPLALRWTGHEPSDEVSAMLRVARARGFDEFRAAFGSFAVPGQNMLYADAAGNIGQVLAVRLPKREGAAPPDVVRDPARHGAAWERRLGVADLPFSLNPDKGYLASANNRPTETEVHLGYFFSPDDRVARMAQLVEEHGRLGLAEVRRLHQDVYMASAVDLRDLFLAKLRETGLVQEAAGQRGEAIALLAEWDGHYRAESPGALAFEVFRHAFGRRFYEVTFDEQDWAAFANFGGITSLMREDIARAAPEALRPALRAGLEAAAARLAEAAEWGAVHRLGLSHPLGLLPVVGRRYRLTDLPVGGSTDTLMKTAHAATEARHVVRYGSNARHISDLSDLDANYFVLLGGQDGWLNSSTFLDQLPLWRTGEYIEVPLRLESVRARFPHTTVLSPR